MSTMRAARFDAQSRQLSVQDVPVPQPKPGEVLVRVAACGICLSDVHLLDGSLPLGLPQVTPGHEAAGTIEQVGRGVPGWQPGDRVLLMGGKPDYTCRNCIRGRLTQCLQPQIMGFHYDGAWAEYVVVPFTGLTSVPDALPLEQVAVPRRRRRDALRRPRRARRAPPRRSRRPAEVLRLTEGLGPDLAVDLVGANTVLAEAAACVGRGGRTLMIGLSLDPIQLGPGMLFGLQSQSLLGHLGYAKHHLDELVTLVASGRLDVSGSISDVLPLDDVGRGVERLATKQGDPVRLVLTP